MTHVDVMKKLSFGKNYLEVLERFSKVQVWVDLLWRKIGKGWLRQTRRILFEMALQVSSKVLCTLRKEQVTVVCSGFSACRLCEEDDAQLPQTVRGLVSLLSFHLAILFHYQ